MQNFKNISAFISLQKLYKIQKVKKFRQFQKFHKPSNFFFNSAKSKF